MLGLQGQIKGVCDNWAKYVPKKNYSWMHLSHLSISSGMDVEALNIE